MSETVNEFRKKFEVDQLTLFETDFWIWSLRPVQATLGSGILSLKRECRKLSELSQDEFCDLKRVIKVIEETLSITFNYDVMNYLMLMMVDKQLHYHIIPRYERIIKFNEISWIDNGWPGVPVLSSTTLDISLLKKIKEMISTNLKDF